MSCQTCGRGDGHNLGCAVAARKRREARAPAVPPVVSMPENTGSRCTKDGCSKPRAASKGPRPAKYCDDHKTTSRKKE